MTPSYPHAGALRWPPDVVEAALGPLLTDERRARIEAVLQARTDEVTVVVEEVSDPHNAAACVRLMRASAWGGGVPCRGSAHRPLPRRSAK